MGWSYLLSELRGHKWGTTLAAERRASISIIYINVNARVLVPGNSPMPYRLGLRGHRPLPASYICTSVSRLSAVAILSSHQFLVGTVSTIKSQFIGSSVISFERKNHLLFSIPFIYPRQRERPAIFHLQCTH